MDDTGRQYERFKKNLIVKMHRPYTEKRLETADISLGGVALYNAERYYDIRQVVSIEILMEGADSIYCDAIIISVYPHCRDASTYKLSLQFIDMSDANKERLKNYLENC